MVENFQSFVPISKSIEEGYLYFIMRNGDRDIGYIGVHPEGDRLFVSKFYITREYRGMGFSGRAFEFLKGICRDNGLKSLYLTVKRDNTRSISVYKAAGLKITGEIDTPIGEGFEMNDYIMELNI
jgi:RimJ/RimL family protein N-acetyltransferase